MGMYCYIGGDCILFVWKYKWKSELWSTPKRIRGIDAGTWLTHM